MLKPNNENLQCSLQSFLCIVFFKKIEIEYTSCFSAHLNTLFVR
jgi:hypothetical protein